MSTRIKAIVGSIAAVGLLAVIVVIGGQWWSHRAAVAALDAPNPTPDQIELIAGLLGDQTGQFSGRAEARLRELGAQSVPALLRVSQSGRTGLRVTAAKLAAEIDPAGGGFDALDRLMQDPGTDTRRAAVEVLSYFARSGSDMLEEPRLVELLRTAGKDADEVIRALVASSLANIPSEDAAELLQGMKQDSDPTVARHAARGLMRQGNARRRRR